MRLQRLNFFLMLLRYVETEPGATFKYSLISFVRIPCFTRSATLTSVGVKSEYFAKSVFDAGDINCLIEV